MLGWLATTARWTTGLFSGLVVLALVAFAALVAGGARPLAVYSGSMEPTIATGALAIVDVVSAESVRRGDVITFSHPYRSDRLVTHRVVEVVRATQGRAYRTKGDANAQPDPWTIALPGSVGRVRASVPYAGYALLYAQTREVRLAVLALCSLLVLTSALRRIWRPRVVAETV